MAQERKLLMENVITVFSTAVISNELAPYKSFKVTIPSDLSSGTKECASDISFISLNKPILEIKMGSYNCRGFNVNKSPAIKSY